jgi:hypothetical protein
MQMVAQGRNDDGEAMADERGIGSLAELLLRLPLLPLACVREESPGSRNPGLDVNPAIASGWNLEGTYCVLGRFRVGIRKGTGISFLIAAR